MLAARQIDRDRLRDGDTSLGGEPLEPERRDAVVADNGGGRALRSLEDRRAAARMATEVAVAPTEVLTPVVAAPAAALAPQEQRDPLYREFLEWRASRAKASTNR